MSFFGGEGDKDRCHVYRKGFRGVATLSLGNTKSSQATLSSVSTWMGDCSNCCLSVAANPLKLARFD